MSSAARVLAVVEYIATADQTPTVSQIAEGAGVPRSTAVDVLADLAQLGYVTVTDRRYRPGRPSLRSPPASTAGRACRRGCGRRSSGWPERGPWHVSTTATHSRGMPAWARSR